MKINRHTVIDAQLATHTLGRYANDADGLERMAGVKNNCEYVSEGTKCYLESIRRIKKGDEILVGYGKDFWKLQRKIISNGKEKALPSDALRRKVRA